MQVIRQPAVSGIALAQEALKLNAELTADWLVRFLQDECIRQRGMKKAILGLSGGVDSAVVTLLCARAFGPDNTHVFRLPYRSSSAESLSHAQLIIDMSGVRAQTIDITDMVDGYSKTAADITDLRRGNICARCRAVILFDQSAKLGGLPIGTGNKTERLFGYFTWHADDSPPINPLGDLFKTQVWELARYLEIPDVIVNKPPTADLAKGQTDEGDLGISYHDADQILSLMVQGFGTDKLIELGFERAKVELAARKVGGTHWKRRLPTVAMLSTSAIGEYYLRPVDY